MDLPDFTRQARAARTAESVLALLRSRVLPQQAGGSLVPFLRVVMGCARHFNEDLDDVDSAVALWSEVYHRTPDPDGARAVIAIMMSVAGKRGHSSLLREERDTLGATRIYEAVYRFRSSPEQDNRVLRTMMDVANRLTDLSRPWSEMDVEGAVALWSALYKLDVSKSDRERAVRTMMDIANRLTDLRIAGAPTDIPGAICIWRAVCELPISDEDKQRAILTALGVATRHSNLNAPKRDRDFATAVRIWQAAWQMARKVDADLALQVVRTMMDVSNRLTDLSGDPSNFDVDAAIVIWAGIVEASAEEEDRDRALRTMMAMANRLLKQEARPDEVLAALKLYHACWRLGPSGADRLRVTKTLFDSLPRIPDACTWAIEALRMEPSAFPDGRFRSTVEAGLLYYRDDFEAVVALVDASPSPKAVLLALRADALRKLQRYDEAIVACSRVLDRPISAGEDAIFDRDARVSAFCCRGYCYLEKGRAEARFLERAIADLEEAAKEAERRSISVPPRVFTGLGYVYRLQGRSEDADLAFGRAVQLDHDNRKAIEAGATRA